MPDKEEEHRAQTSANCEAGQRSGCLPSQVTAASDCCNAGGQRSGSGVRPGVECPDLAPDCVVLTQYSRGATCAEPWNDGVYCSDVWFASKL